MIDHNGATGIFFGNGLYGSYRRTRRKIAQSCNKVYHGGRGERGGRLRKAAIRFTTEGAEDAVEGLRYAAMGLPRRARRTRRKIAQRCNKVYHGGCGGRRDAVEDCITQI